MLRLYFITFTANVSFSSSQIKATVAVPFFFFALISNRACPLASVVAFLGVTEIYPLLFFPIFAVTTSPSTEHPSLPVTVIITSVVRPFLIFKVGDIDIAAHSAGVAVPAGVGVIETVGVGTGDGVGFGGKAGVAVIVGVGFGDGVGDEVGTGVDVAVGDGADVGVGAAVAVGVAAGVDVAAGVGDGDAAGVGVTDEALSVVKSQL